MYIMEHIIILRLVCVSSNEQVQWKQIKFIYCDDKKE